MIIIDGTTYNVPVVGVEETCEFLDKYAERTQDGRLHRELIGTYKNQSIQFGTPTTAAELADMTALWAKLIEPVEFHTVTVPDEDGADFTFSAYFSSVSRSVQKWKAAKTTWKNLTVKFTAEAPFDTP